MSSAWGYTSISGPHTWSKQFPLASGTHQSPVDIRPDETRLDPALASRPLIVDYRETNCKAIVNPGYSWKVDAEGGVLTGGPLLHRYELEQFHSHWGRTDSTGSEHTVDGKKYPAELHLVHWNTDLYENFGAAAAAGDGTGLAVLGVFLEVGEENPAFGKLTSALGDVQFSGQEAPLAEDIDITALLPSDRSYWTYSGSLTTPPCYESVTWIVFQKAISISTKQLDKFRELRSYCSDQQCPQDEYSGQIVENYRPPLPLGGRIVRACYSC